MPPDKVSQFFRSTIALINLFAKACKNLPCLVIKKIKKNIVFIFKIKIYGTIRNTGFPGNLRYGRLKKTLLGKDLDGGI